MESGARSGTRVLAGVLLLTVVSAASGQDSAGDPSAVPLRTVAERLGLQIGFASGYNFDERLLDARYRAVVEREFNIVTPESVMKWETLRPTPADFDFSGTDRVVEFAATHDLAVHAHPLLWYTQNAPWVDILPSDQVSDTVSEHIEAVMRRYAGEFSIVDVVNEPLSDDGASLRASPFLGADGVGYIDRALRAARAADPQAGLLVNEYDVGWLNPKSDAYHDLVSGLLERDVPLDAVGFQMHIDHTFDQGEGLSANLQRFAEMGLDLYITEFDVGVTSPDDYDRQADVYGDVLQRCLMQPRCKAFQIWGVDDFYSWRPYVDPLPFDDTLQSKPAWRAMQQALSSTPVHVETCEAGDASAGNGAVTGAARIVCRDVALSGAYSRVRVRYANSGLETPTLSLSANRQRLGEVMLAPVPADAQGNFRTVDVLIEPVATTADLALDIAGAVQGVSLDALLFLDPAFPVLEDRSDPDYTVPIAAPASGVPAADELVAPDSGEAMPSAQDEIAVADNSSERSGGSGGGAVWLLLALLPGSLVGRRIPPTVQSAVRGRACSASGRSTATPAG